MRNTEDFVRLKENIPEIPIPVLKGSLIHHTNFPSKYIRSRPVDVWLPEGYDPKKKDGYPVIYMHDGQMIFHHKASSLAGMDVFWDTDKVITCLIDEGVIRRPIVVATWMADWNKGARGAEYMPQKPVTPEIWRIMRKADSSFHKDEGGDILSSDQYLQFLVSELKPFIDREYRTLCGAKDTFMIGSSMGGLISAYAITEYPDIFGGAACMSTAWDVGQGVVVDWFSHHWPTAGGNRLYFDYGTETLDANYEPYQQKMDEVMRKFGYAEGVDWMTKRFEGADHTPRAWRERLHIPLKFLLGKS